MAVSVTPFGRLGLHLLRGEINIPLDTIKVALTPAGWTFDADNDEVISDIDQIAAGNGYTAGGVTLQNKTVTYDAAVDRTKVKASNVSWTTGSGNSLSARGAVVYKHTGNPATSWLIGFIDFGETVTANSSEFIVAWDADGVLSI